MKKINLLLFALVMLAGTSFAQTQKAVWPEMKAFHAVMSSTFHPAEEGNLDPLKAKAESLYNASKTWYASEVPSDFKAEETKATLKKLMIECSDLWAAVAEKKLTDAQLKEMITKAHDTFHKVAGECRKAE